MYLNLLINKLKSICNSPFAEEMIKPHIDELTPFLFEFKVLVASFKRMVRLHKLENSGEKNITRLYSRFELFHKALKERKAYGKVIEFDFEQKLCYKLDHDNSKSTCSSLEKIDQEEDLSSPTTTSNVTPVKQNVMEFHLNRDNKNKSSDWCSQERTKTDEYTEAKRVKTKFSNNDAVIILTPLRPKINFDFKIRNLSNLNENRKLIKDKIHKIILARNEVEK